MSDAEGVVFALGACRKGRKTSLLLDRVEPAAPAGQDLVRIGLMTDVPDDAVVRRPEHVVQRNGQLDRAKPRGEMTAARRDGIDQVCAQLVGERSQL